MQSHCSYYLGEGNVYECKGETLISAILDLTADLTYSRYLYYFHLLQSVFKAVLFAWFLLRSFGCIVKVKDCGSVV